MTIGSRHRLPMKRPNTWLEADQRSPEAFGHSRPAMANHSHQKTRHKAMKYILGLILLLLFITSFISYYYLNSINSLPNSFDPSLNPTQDDNDRQFEAYFKTSRKKAVKQKNSDKDGPLFEESVSLEFKCKTWPRIPLKTQRGVYNFLDTPASDLESQPKGSQLRDLKSMGPQPRKAKFMEFQPREP